MDFRDVCFPAVGVGVTGAVCPTRVIVTELICKNG